MKHKATYVSVLVTSNQVRLVTTIAGCHTADMNRLGRYITRSIRYLVASMCRGHLALLAVGPCKRVTTMPAFPRFCHLSVSDASKDNL